MVLNQCQNDHTSTHGMLDIIFFWWMKSEVQDFRDDGWTQIRDVENKQNYWQGLCIQI